MGLANFYSCQLMVFFELQIQSIVLDLETSTLANFSPSNFIDSCEWNSVGIFFFYIFKQLIHMNPCPKSILSFKF